MNLDRESRLKLLIQIITVGFAVAVIWAYAHQSWGYPHNTFLFDPNDRYKDFLNLFLLVQKTPDPYDSPLSVYLPFTFVPLQLLAGLSQHGAFNLCLGSFWLFVCAICYQKTEFASRSVRWQFALTICLMSYPVLMLLDRGNLEFFVFMLLSSGVFLLLKDRLKAGAVLIGLAAATKIYPALYILLAFRKRNWRELFVASAISGSTFALATVASATLFSGGIATCYAKLAVNLKAFQSNYIYPGNAGLHYGVAIFSTLKMALFALFSSDQQELIARLRTLIAVWPVVALVIAGIVLGLALWKRIPTWRLVTCITFLTLVLPQVSYDYKLIHLLVPLLLFVREETPFSRPSWTFAYTILFALLLIPKTYIFIHSDISIATVIEPLLMCTMIGGFFVDAWVTETSTKAQRASDQLAGTGALA